MAKKQTIAFHEEFQNLLSDIHQLQDELAALYFEKDELQYQICKNIEMEYMLKIGALEYNLYEKETQILRIKRKIELIRQKINRQETFILETIEKQLDTEYEEYTKKLKAQYDIFQNALNRKESGFLDKDKAKDVKKLYGIIVKKLHPDLLPEPDKAKNELFLKAVEAYKTGDYESLSAISLMVDKPDPKSSKLNTTEELKKRHTSLQERIININASIEDIKKSFPYNQLDFLKSPELVDQKKQELTDKIDEYNAIYIQYEQRLNDLTGGAQ
ncbi:hypothetical protein [Leadbettera azotonutricia]|uniref:Molecular chaperone DnaJ n=1 Tax=Leadbettera azotonutricia (strain ATCC BAA-888 / DSM 13862 / ZAS-9) TaxID=545695 RepID=F5YCZ1_LEAAZ|nr:hypothetical protein [Leadbettera azotonutricia]AEF81875.1 conserved hypothetical protein [Leadbettera azotonutricia ZAS-9]